MVIVNSTMRGKAIYILAMEATCEELHFTHNSAQQMWSPLIAVGMENEFKNCTTAQLPQPNSAKLHALLQVAVTVEPAHSSKSAVPAAHR
jgi:hypothetical protein